MTPDWPATLLLKELRLKLLRKIVHEMESRELWMVRARSDEVIQGRKQFSLSIQDELLYSALGHDFFLLHTQSLFGAANVQFASKVPLPLVFGYDIGMGIHDILAPMGIRGDQIAKLCALFNLAVSMFDYFCDNIDQNAVFFSELLDESSLVDMIDSGCRYTTNKRFGTKVEKPEARVLLRALSAFFFDLHANKIQYKTQEWNVLKTRVLDAYTFQMQTCLDRRESEPRLDLLASEKKSTLPFLIMSQLTRVCEMGETEESDAAYIIEKSIANIFWELDDLTDLTEDIKKNQINSIVARAEMIHSEYKREQTKELLIYFLEGDALTTAIDAFCAHLGDLMAVLGNRPGSLNAPPFSELLLSYVCNSIPIK